MSDFKREERYLDTVTERSLRGITKIYDGLIALEGCNTILRKDYVNMNGKVKLISAGRDENVLIDAGYVGHGMLTATIFGNISSSAKADNILRVIEEVNFAYSSSSPGTLIIVQNDLECIINFTLAKLQAEEMGHVIRMIAVNNNNDILRTMDDATDKKQNILPLLFIYKIAGAMSAEGLSIDEIYTLCNSVANSGEIVTLETDIGKMTHEAHHLELLANKAKELIKPITDMLSMPMQKKDGRYENKNFCIGHEIAVMINNFGCSQMLASIFLLEFLEELEKFGLLVKRIYLKPSMASSSNNSLHICLLNLSFTQTLIKYLDFQTPAFGWPKTMDFKEMHERKLVTSGICPKNASCSDISLQGPTMDYETSQAFLLIISMACEAITACTNQLNRMDEDFGSGRYGSRLAYGAKAVQDAIEEKEILGTYPYVTFTQISYIIQKTVDGMQGGLYSLFFYNIAKAFSEYQNDVEVTVDIWLNVLNTANKAMEQFRMSSKGEQKLLAVLADVQMILENALNENMDPIDAFGLAVKAPESFTTNVLYQQHAHGLKYPDPQVHAVGIWMRAAYEGMKLKLSNRKR